MEISIKESTRMGSSMDLECTNGLMELFMMDNS